MGYKPTSGSGADRTEHPPSPLAQGRLRLADGRQLTWFEFGRQEGTPVLYCHGSPGSGLEAALAATAAAGLGIRLIAPDRPGYGLSSPSAAPTPLSAAQDLHQLCDHLDLRRLFLFGVSGGAPLACAAARDLGQRVVALGLACPVAPLFGCPPAELPLFPWRLLRYWGRWQWPPLRLVLSPILCLIRRAPYRYFQRATRRLAGIDRDILADPVTAYWLQASLARAFQAGSYGLLDDIVGFGRNWGAALGTIHCPVSIWHGLDDRGVPPRFGARLARQFDNCTPRFLAGEGHFSLPIRHAARLLDELIHGVSTPVPSCYTEQPIE